MSKLIESPIKKLALKVNYVKVVDQLLKKKYCVIISGRKMKKFNKIVEEAMYRYSRPYYYDVEEDKKDFEKEQYDRGFKGNYNDW